MSNCNVSSGGCSGCSSAGSCDGKSCAAAAPALTKAQQTNRVKNVIVVMSGKGGVGKSSFSSLIAITLHKQGKKVGILDGDITGPSIPKLFGVKGLPKVEEKCAYPLESAGGIKIMSMNLMMKNEEEPVVWRGPVISGVIKQFWEEVYWGELDYLIVDLPPGTGDAPLTILQTLPVTGVIVITSPQDLSNMVVRKGIKMLEMMKIPALGIAENMSYFQCGKCGEKYNIFGESKVTETCNKYQVPLIGKFPLDTEISRLGDLGEIEKYQGVVLEMLMENLPHFLPQE